MTVITRDGRKLSTSTAAMQQLRGEATLASITVQVIELAHDAWKRERRGYHGEWVGGEGIALRVLGIKSKHGYLQGEYHGPPGGMGPWEGKKLTARDAQGIAEMLAAFHAEQGRGGVTSATLRPGSFRRGPSSTTIYDLPGAAAQGSAPAEVAQSAEAAGFHGPLASKVSLGGDPAHWGELASALNAIPAPLQERMSHAVGEVRITDHIPVPEGLEGEGNIVGLYNPGEHGWANDANRGKGNGLLQLTSEADSAGTARHEAMHALDESMGYPSDKFHWRRLAWKIRRAMGDKAAPEFQSSGTGNDARRSAEELWAELASQLLGGSQRLDLDPVRGGKTFYGGGAFLPDDLAAEVRDYFAAEGVKP